MSVTDLTGTSWEFNSLLDFTSFDNIYNVYSLNYICDNLISDGLDIYFDMDFGWTLDCNNIGVIYTSFDGWEDNNYKIINITGGTDATNQSLITWLQSNATQIQTGPTQLTAPTITRSNFNNSVSLNWDRVSHADYYEIYKDDSLVTTVSTPAAPELSWVYEYYITGVPGVYKIKACSNDTTNYSTSEFSNAITFTLTQLSTPVISKSGDDGISWASISNSIGYAIYRNGNQYTTTNGNRFRAIENGTYQVKAIGDGVEYSNSSLSNSISIIIPLISSFNASTVIDNGEYITLIIGESRINITKEIIEVTNFQLSNGDIFRLSNGDSFAVAEEYTITTSITNGTYSGAISIIENGTASVTLSADSGYSLPSSIEVSGASYTYDSTSGVVNLSNATGDVTITCVCEVVASGYNVTVSGVYETQANGYSLAESITIDGVTSSVDAMGVTTNIPYVFNSVSQFTINRIVGGIGFKVISGSGVYSYLVYSEELQSGITYDLMENSVDITPTSDLVIQLGYYYD